MIPRIVIVGRPNVGKSSLLNMLARRRVSIVDPTAGVTRDRISTFAEIPAEDPTAQPFSVELVDTGGYGIDDAQNLTADIERQIARGVAEADLLLFVVDAQTGVMPLDQTVAELLRKTALGRSEVMLVANKVDMDKFESSAAESMQLGFGEPVLISATTGYNKHELYTQLRERLKLAERSTEASDLASDAAALDPGIRLAIVGKRNAGKSTLVNALAGDERVIVSEIAGTTRDSVDVRVDYKGKIFTAIDTAGVRKRKSLADDLEYYAQHRSLRSVRRADVCLLLIDAEVPVSQVDHQLADEILKHHRPTVIVVNKWDLAEKQHTQEEYVEYLDREMKGLDFAPIVFISAREKQGLPDVLAMAENLYQQAGHRVPTGELNQVLETVKAERGPSSKGGRHAKIFYGTQMDVHPPTIVMFVNDPALFDHNYQRFLMNRFRDLLPYSEVPIRLLIRGRDHAEEQELHRNAGKP